MPLGDASSNSNHSRDGTVLAWKLSITLETEFCLEAVEEALARYGKPEIFNTDQGSQFTSIAFTSLLLKNEIKISMDGKGAWRDNIELSPNFGDGRLGQAAALA
jgi:transposase InsO family protein